MAFGIKRSEIVDWKRKIDNGEIAFLTHYWLDDRFPGFNTVTKVGCADLGQLAEWGRKYGLKEEWIHHRPDGYSHFDLIGEKQKTILLQEGLVEHIWNKLQNHYRSEDMLKIGVIGLGDIAKKAYLPVYSGICDVEFHLFTRNETKLDEVCQKYRFVHKHTNMDSLMESGISAAFVHSSTESHYEIVKELLINHIHVYVDKPITYDYETAKELIELAESKNLILMIGFNRRFAPANLAANEVKDPNMIILQKNRHGLPNDARTFVFDDYIHVLDTVRFLMPDEIQEIQVTGRKKENLLYHVVVQFRSENGALGIAIMNRDSGAREEKLEVMGPEEKRVVLNLADLIIQNSDGETKISFKDWDTTLYKRGFEQIIAEFIQAVRTNTPTSITARDALKTHEICEEIVRQLESL